MAAPKVREIISNKKRRDQATKGKYMETNVNSDQNQCHYEQVGREEYHFEKGANGTEEKLLRVADDL